MTSNHFIWIGLVALLVFWGVGAYNRLVRLKNTIVNAFGQIDVQLKRRYELVFKLVEAAKKYLPHDTATLEAVTLASNLARSAGDAARRRPTSTKAVTCLSEAEMSMSGSLGRLFVAAQAHPEFKADETTMGLVEELTNTDNKVGFSRQTYNEAVRDYNNAQGEFPTVLLARLFGFGPSAMLQTTQSPEELQALHMQL